MFTLLNPTAMKQPQLKPLIFSDYILSKNYLVANTLTSGAYRSEKEATGPTLQRLLMSWQQVY